MDISKLYVPSHEKWQNFYDNLFSNVTNTNSDTPVHGIRENKKDISIASLSSSRSMVPLHSVKKIVNDSSENSIPLKLVSPVQMTTDQAKSELERVSSEEIIKSHRKANMKHNAQGIRRKRNNRLKKPVNKSKKKKKNT